MGSRLSEYLKKHGRVDYDGRPIFKIPCDEFVYELAGATTFSSTNILAFLGVLA